MTIIEDVKKSGQSLWYDNIERAKLFDGSLKSMISAGKIRGITSNPSIFQKAIATSNDYDVTLKPMAWAGLDSESIFWQLAIEDIQKAAQLFLPIFDTSKGLDGFVSLEVSPLLAYDTERTVKEARELWARVNMPNLMIKIPATKEGIPAIRRAIAAGINVNVTLIFSNDRYKEVMGAYIAGLEDRLAQGLPVEHIASVASFFVSRIDTKIDSKLQDQVKGGNLTPGEYAILAGKAAIANAKLAYQQFEEVFTSDRFNVLKDHGAHVQRPLWASTSTKNPAYRDVIYVEELIAPDSVNTVPPATLEAFLEHGVVEITIRKDLDQANDVFTMLEARGIKMQQVTDELEEEGVKAFSDAYSTLLESVEQRRISAVEEIAPIKEVVQEKLAALKQSGYPRRLFEKDPSLWTEDLKGQEEIRIRMDWLETPYKEIEMISHYAGLGRKLRDKGFTNAVLLGMGGSSLAPEVMCRILKARSVGSADELSLTVLDSTDPLQVIATTDNSPAKKTVYIVASKSGTTGEINAFFDHFWKRTEGVVSENPGNHFVTVTDPGTRLAELGKEKGFWGVYQADPRVGGRNSALTAFGLVPAAIMGLDLRKILENAVDMADLCAAERPAEANPGVMLGTILGSAALHGRNKVTFLTEGAWVSFGDWLEQLIAESSGKDGKGILPVTNEPEMDPENYSSDRFFVYFEKNGERIEKIEALKAAGHPVISLHIAKDEDLPGQFYLWEIAVATACSIIGVNSFDQPDVQDAKMRTLAGLEAYKKTGELPVISPKAQFKGINILSVLPDGLNEYKNLLELISSMLTAKAKTTDYIAINAFLPKNSENEMVLQEFRRRLGEKFRLPTTLGFGPRYLHSTGQLHKGGPNTGLFLIVTAQRQKDLEIPGQGVTFGVMQRAQAIGDLQALIAKDRQVLWIDLEQPDAKILLTD